MSTIKNIGNGIFYGRSNRSYYVDETRQWRIIDGGRNQPYTGQEQFIDLPSLPPDLLVLGAELNDVPPENNGGKPPDYIQLIEPQ